MKVLISGASGLVGRACLSKLRGEGHTVSRLVRPGAAVGASDVRWNPAAGTLDAPALTGADAVVHLGGASIAGGRWTRARKAELRTSRIDSTRLLVDAIAQMREKPRVFLCASAIGYYGNRRDELLSEASAPGDDFLAQLVRDWEAEAMRAEFAGIRTGVLRFGLILSRDGGALPRMLSPFRVGLGGRFGDGRQWMSWIALADTVEIISAALMDGRFSGPVNMVSPNAVRNAEFTRTLAAALHRPAVIAVPRFALRLALGEMADALLASDRVHPERLLALAYKFRFPELPGALRVMLGA